MRCKLEIGNIVRYVSLVVDALPSHRAWLREPLPVAYRMANVKLGRESPARKCTDVQGWIVQVSLALLVRSFARTPFSDSQFAVHPEDLALRGIGVGAVEHVPGANHARFS